MLGKMLFPAKNETLRVSFATSLFFTTCFVLCSVQSSSAQFSISATEVETWLSPTPV